MGLESCWGISRARIFFHGSISRVRATASVMSYDVDKSNDKRTATFRPLTSLHYPYTICTMSYRIDGPSKTITALWLRFFVCIPSCHEVRLDVTFSNNKDICATQEMTLLFFTHLLYVLCLFEINIDHNEVKERM